MEAIKELEDHLEDLEIRPMPEAQFVVYNRVPKVRFFKLFSGYVSFQVCVNVNDDAELQARRKEQLQSRVAVRTR